MRDERLTCFIGLGSSGDADGRMLGGGGEQDAMHAARKAYFLDGRWSITYLIAQ